MVIDTHVHLDDRRLIGELNTITADMKADNLAAVITIGCDLRTSKNSLRIASEKEGVFAALGIHPHEAKGATEAAFDYIIKNAAHKKVVAIGECGLDYYYDHSPRETQREVCQRQIKIAEAAKLPLVFHCRDAYEDMHKILEQNKARLSKCGGVMHCYSGSREMAKIFLDYGLYIAFGGTLTFKTAVRVREVLQYVPRDRILLETDCPYMTPEPHRGQTNYPKYVNYVAHRMAEEFNLPLAEVEKMTTDNAKRLFFKLAEELK